MVNLFMDGYVLACPHASEGLAAAERFVNGLIAWQELAKADWATLYLSVRAYDTLADQDCFPATDRIHALVGRYQMNVDVRDIATLVNGFLSRVPTLEDHFQIAEVSVRSAVFTAAFLADGRPIRFREDLEWLMIQMAAADFVGRLPKSNSLLLVRTPDVDFEDIRVDAHADICVFRPDDLKFGCDLAFSTRACATVAGLLASIDPVALWIDGKTEVNCRQALLVAISQHVPRELEADVPLFRQWTFGRDFLSSAASLGFGADASKVRRLLRACRSTVLNEELALTHTIRVSRGGGSRDLKRGQDTAWRRDIDREYHLHYWATSNGPEFANVVQHSDLSITQ